MLARHEIRAQFRTFLWLAVVNGPVFNLYSNAYTATTVFNVLFLFYLSPIWSNLIARFWFKERVSTVWIGCVVAGLAGLVDGFRQAGVVEATAKIVPAPSHGC